MKRKIIFRNILLAAVVFLAVIGGWIAWSAWNNDDDFHFRPEVIIRGITIEDNSAESLKVYATVNILNDVPFEARIRSLKYTLAHEGIVIAKNLSRESATIRSRDTTQTTLAFLIGKDELQVLAAKLETADSDLTRFTLDLFFELDVPVRGYREFNITKEIEVPVIRLPIVKSRKLHVEKFSLSHPELQMDLLVSNPNSYPLMLSNCKVSMTVGDDLRRRGSAEGIQRIGPQSSEEILLALQVEDMKLMKVAWKSLFREDETKFESKFSFQIISKNKVVDKSQLVILKSGMLGELKSR